MVHVVHFSQFFTLAAFGDGTEGVEKGREGIAFAEGIFYSGFVIGGRLGIWKEADAGEAACGGGICAGGEGFAVFVTRIAEMAEDIYPSWGDGESFSAYFMISG